MTTTGRLCLSRLVLCLGMVGRLAAQVHPIPEAPPKSSAEQKLPEGPGKETVQRICGSCHNANIVLSRGLSRDGWSEVVTSMISRGAKGTPGELTDVVNYLAKSFPPKQARGGAAGSPRRAGPSMGFTVGPDDKQIVDEAAAARGGKIYGAECSSCHGAKARGTDKGPDLDRSLTVMHDRYGSTIGPFLQKSHPLTSGAQSASLSQVQIGDLSHFLHLQLNDTLRSGPYSKVLNVLTGDPKAGAAYFNGAGTCASCHSTSGDLAGIASKYDPPTLQQRFLFPRTLGFSRNGAAPSKPVTVTVTTPDGRTVSGALDKIDDFDVSLRTEAGDYRSFKRTPELKLERHDPYTAHIQLLDRYTDKNVHDVVAYLETLK